MTQLDRESCKHYYWTTNLVTPSRRHRNNINGINASCVCPLCVFRGWAGHKNHGFYLKPQKLKLLELVSELVMSLQGKGWILMSWPDVCRMAVVPFRMQYWGWGVENLGKRIPAAASGLFININTWEEQLTLTMRTEWEVALFYFSIIWYQSNKINSSLSDLNPSSKIRVKRSLLSLNIVSADYYDTYIGWLACLIS